MPKKQTQSLAVAILDAHDMRQVLVTEESLLSRLTGCPPLVPSEDPFGFFIGRVTTIDHGMYSLLANDEYSAS